MHHAIAGKLGVLQAGNHAENALLLAEFQAGLEPHQVVHRARRVILAQLHNGIGLLARARINQPNGLHRPKGQHHVPAARHAFHRHTAFKYHILLKAMDGRGFGAQKRLHKGVILLTVHRAIEIIIPAIIARGAEHLLHIQRFRHHDGRGRIIKMQRAHAGQMGDGIGHRVAGQGAGRHNDRAVGDFADFALLHRDVGMAAQRIGNHARKALPIHRQSPSGGHAGSIRRAHHQRVQRAHFLLEQAHGVLDTIRSQGIAAHQLCKQRAFMRGAHLLRLHFIQRYRHAAPGQLPGRLAARQARAYDCRPHSSVSSCFTSTRWRQASLAHK